MAYDEKLAARVRELVGGEANLTEKRMFGGLAFLVDGNMSVSVSGQGGLLLRCDPAKADAFLDEPHAHQMIMRGRPMDGWLRVEPEAVRTKRELAKWVSRGLGYARTLPAKD